MAGRLSHPLRAIVVDGMLVTITTAARQDVRPSFESREPSRHLADPRNLTASGPRD